MNQKFHDTFSYEELKRILKAAIAYNNNVIVICTSKLFFELSADMGDHLQIYFEDEITKENKLLSKEEFLKNFLENSKSDFTPDRYISIDY